MAHLIFICPYTYRNTLLDPLIVYMYSIKLQDTRQLFARHGNTRQPRATITIQSRDVYDTYRRYNKHLVISTAKDTYIHTCMFVGVHARLSVVCHSGRCGDNLVAEGICL